MSRTSDRACARAIACEWAVRPRAARPARLSRSALVACMLVAIAGGARAADECGAALKAVNPSIAQADGARIAFVPRSLPVPVGQHFDIDFVVCGVAIRARRGGRGGRRHAGAPPRHELPHACGGVAGRRVSCARADVSHARHLARDLRRAARRPHAAPHPRARGSVVMSWRRVMVALVAALAASAPATAVTPLPLLDFSADEVQRIARHGPWPPARALDPGNAVAAQPAAIELGQRLFFDARLSIDGTMSCATCHQPLLAFADARKRSQGRQTLDRNAPSLWNAVHERWYGWDGAADSLWAQAIRPILHAHEMDAMPQHVRDTLGARRRVVVPLSPGVRPRAGRRPRDRAGQRQQGDRCLRRHAGVGPHAVRCLPRRDRAWRPAHGVALPGSCAARLAPVRRPRPTATSATWARCSATASSATPGCRSSCGPAWSTPGATKASSCCS